MRIMLGILPGVPEALAMTESLISGGCAARCIFLMIAQEGSVSPVLQQGSLLASLGEHRGASVYGVGDWKHGGGVVFDKVVQQRRFAHLIDRFATHYPAHWEFHHDLVKDGSPVGVVHLEEPLEDEASIARTLLSHSVTRLQISDLPDYPESEQ